MINIPFLHFTKIKKAAYYHGLFATHKVKKAVELAIGLHGLCFD